MTFSRARRHLREEIAVAKYVVAPADAISPSGRKLFEVDGRKIIVFNLAGEFFAVSDSRGHDVRKPARDAAASSAIWRSCTSPLPFRTGGHVI
jgi:hypothetical protein